MTLRCLLAMAREAWDVLRPRTIQEVADAIWDQATRKTSAAPVAHSRSPSVAAEEPAPARCSPLPQQSAAGAGNQNWEKRFDAADWLQERLTNAGMPAGAGWVLAIVDGVAERLQ